MFLISGSLIMRFFGFDLPSPQIAGGLVAHFPGIFDAGETALHHERLSTRATKSGRLNFSPWRAPHIRGSANRRRHRARNTTVRFRVGIVLEHHSSRPPPSLLCATRHLDRQAGVGAIVVRILRLPDLVIGVDLCIHGVRALPLFDNPPGASSPHPRVKPTPDSPRTPPTA